MQRWILRRRWWNNSVIYKRFYSETITPIVVPTTTTTPIKEEEPKSSKSSKEDKDDSKKSKTFKEYLMYLKFIKHAATTLALITVSYAIFLETTSTKRSVHALESPQDPTLQNWESEDLALSSSSEFQFFQKEFQLRHQQLTSLLSSQNNHVIILSGKHSIGKSVSMRYLARQLQSLHPTHMLELKTKTPSELAQEVSELIDYNQDYITNTLQSFNFIRNPTTDLRMVIQHLEKACIVLQQQKKHPPLLIIDQVDSYSHPENLDFLMDLAKDFSKRNLAHFVFVTDDTYTLQQKYPKWSQQTICHEIQEYQNVEHFLEHQLHTTHWNKLITKHVGGKFQLLHTAIHTLLAHKTEWNSSDFVHQFEWNVLQQRKVKQFLTSENGTINYLSNKESNGVVALLEMIEQKGALELINCCEMLDKHVKEYRRSLQIIHSLIENQILYCNCQSLVVSLNV